MLRSKGRTGSTGGERGLVLADLVILLLSFLLLLAFAVPELTAARRRSIQAGLRSDLRRLAAAQESYFFDHHVYSADPAALQDRGFRPSENVQIVVNEATQTGWSATASHAQPPARCFVFARSAAPVGPAVKPGDMRCD